MKTSLRNFQNDIDTIIKKIVDVYDRQRFAFVFALNQIKNIFFSRLNKSIFRNLRTLIIFFALIEILHQYEKLMNVRNNNISFFFCIKRFKNFMSLFCVHIIEKRMIDANRKKILLFIDVHSHWRFKKSKRHYVDSAIFVDIEMKMKKTSIHDSLLNIQNSQKMRSKNRFKFASNRSKIVAKQICLEKRQRTFNNFTQRMFFDFEHAQTIDLTIDEIMQIFSNQFFSFNYTIMFFYQINCTVNRCNMMKNLLISLRSQSIQCKSSSNANEKSTSMQISTSERKLIKKWKTCEK